MGKLQTFFLQIKNGSLKDEFKVIWKFFYNNAVAYILLYIQNILINHYMPTGSLGLFSYGQSMLVLFSSIFSMEVYSSYLRFIGCNDEKHLTQIIKRILLIASTLFSIVVLVYFKSPLYILFVGYMWMHERLFFFRAKMNITTYGRIKILQYFVSIIILIALIVFGKLSEKSMLAGIGISYVIVSLVYLFYGKYPADSEPQTELPKVSIKDIIKYSVPMSFNAIVVWLLGAADQMLINNYLDSTTLTYYSIGFRIISVIRIGVGVIMEYWPRFYFERMDKRDYPAVRSMYIVFMLVVVVLCVGSILFCKPLYWIMGASKYNSECWMFCVLAAAELFRQWGSINMTFQAFMKNNTINVACLSILGGTKLLVNWLLIDKLGVSILLYTTLGCYMLYFVCSLFWGWRCEKKYISITKGKD